MQMGSKFTGIEAKAKELGMEWTGDHGGIPESFQQFTKRVRHAAEPTNVIPLRDKKLESCGG